MSSPSIKPYKHEHDFAVVNQKGEKGTLYVLILTAVTMVVEIVAGSVYGSMALLADGWHMATHVAAFMMTLFAYRYARKHAQDPAFSFGTGKVSTLGGFASAVSLAAVALMMLIESVGRMFEPHAIAFDQAIIVASLGLVVNLASAFLLGHDHDHDHSSDDKQVDHNLRAAYFHVLADALTSLLAIAALFTGKLLGWHRMDPMMGVVGALIITHWAYKLIKTTSPILLDATVEGDYPNAIIDVIEREDQTRVTDIHVWRVGDNHYSAIISVVTCNPKSTNYYKSLLGDFTFLSHITVEVNEGDCSVDCCDTDPC